MSYINRLDRCSCFRETAENVEKHFNSFPGVNSRLVNGEFLRRKKRGG